MSVAGLPMYDWPEIRYATDALWAGVSARLRDAKIPTPTELNRELSNAQLWLSPDLVLAQTCGLPYASSLREKVSLVATPVYDVEGCQGPNYSSMVIVRGDEPANDLAAMLGRIAAVNDLCSLSGCLLLRASIAAENDGATIRGVLSGSHRQSMQMVADGRADICAIDAVCWALAQEHMSSTVSRLRVLGRSPTMPALPFICAGSTPLRTQIAIRTALAAALADPSFSNARRALHLHGVEALDERTYDPVIVLERRAPPVEIVCN